MLKDLTVTSFIAETASSAPVPGGGSIAALNGAIASALAQMVAQLTIGKKRYVEVEEEMKELVEEAGKLQKELIEDIDRDSKAYQMVFDAFKLPKETDEEKAYRSAQIQERTKEAALIPMQVARRAYAVMDFAEKVVEKGNNNAITDGCSSMMLARNAVIGALLNVRINLTSIKDQEFVKQLETEADDLEKRAIEREKVILDKTKEALR